MEQKKGVTSTSQAKLRILSGRLLMLATLLVNIITTIGVIWIAFKIGINRNPQELMYHIIEGANGDELSFNENIQTDTLVVGDSLGAESISHEQISIVGKTANKSPQPEISLNPDYISMQAKSFGPDGSLDNQYQFKLDRELENLEISHEANNVRSIRASFDRAGEGVPGRSGDLSIESSDELELSGNLGLAVHSKDIVLNSKKGIVITSGENVIDIRSAGGLFLPNIQFVSQSEDIELNAENDLDNDDRRRQLCIRKSDGSLFRARMHNC